MLNDITIATVAGTARPGNYTSRALDLVDDELREAGVRVVRVDAAELDLPFPGQEATAEARWLRDTISGAAGVVLATPEYHGSFSSMLKLIIENLGFPSDLAGKPVSLLGVAAGSIGAIKSLEQLRGVCSHVGAIPLPSSVSVAKVRDVFDDDGSCTDARVEKHVRSVGTNLLDYLERHVCPALTLEAVVRGEIDPAGLDGRALGC